MYECCVYSNPKKDKVIEFIFNVALWVFFTIVGLHIALQKNVYGEKKIPGCDIVQLIVWV